MIRTAFLTTALAVAVLSTAAIAQTKQATAAEAAPFLGTWTLDLQGPNGPASMQLVVKVESDKVVGEISNASSTNQKITDVTKADKTLVMRYSFDYQGTAVDAAVQLTPAADGKSIGAQIDFAGGAYVMTGTATKKDK